MAINHVNGDNKGDVMLYALSTCVWCKKTKALLDEMKVEYKYMDVDLLDKAEKPQVMDEVRKWNPACSFPSMVVNNAQCIIGFDEERIRDALK